MSAVRPTNAPPKKASRLRAVLLGGAVAVFLLAVGFLVLWGVRDGALTRAAAELDAADPGWRLGDIVKARADVPDDENSAAAIRLVHREGRALSGEEAARLSDVEPGERMKPEDAKRIGELLAANARAVAAARLLAEMPRGRHRLEIDEVNPWRTLFEDQQNARHAAFVLRLDAMRLALDGRGDDALRNVRAALNVAASFGDEPFLISTLIRFACRSQAVGTLEHSLALAEASPAELGRVGAALLAEERDDAYGRGVRGERAMTFASLRSAISGRAKVTEMGIQIDPYLAFESTYLSPVTRYRVSRDAPGMLRYSTRWVEITGMPDHDQVKAEADLYADRAAFATSPDLFRNMILDPRKIGTPARRTKALLRAARAAVAAERYRLDKAAWPAALVALVPAYLAAVPLDPFDGKPLRLKREADGLTIYSVGENLKDDGGDTLRRKPGPHPTDTGFRLWDAAARRRLRAEELGEPKAEK